MAQPGAMDYPNTYLNYSSVSDDYLLWLASMCRCRKSYHLIYATSWLHFVFEEQKCNIENGIVNLKDIMFYNKLIMKKQPRRLITALYQ